MSKKSLFFPVVFGTVAGVITLGTPLSFAQGGGGLPDVAAKGGIGEVRRMLDAGVAVDSRQTITGWTPLIAAARAGRMDVAALLLERGANPNAAGATGYTPLMAATQTRNLALIRLLLLRGANPDLATPKGLTPLMLAAGNKGDASAQTKDLECVKLLLRGGANPEKKHSSGATAYTVAVERGAAVLAAYLRRVGATGSEPSGGAVLKDGAITGSVSYRERIAVSPATFAIVRLVDAAPRTPAVLVQTVVPFAGRQVPVPFSLPYKAAVVSGRPNARLMLDARIVSGGAVRFLSAKPTPAFTGTPSDKRVQLVLTLASPDVQARLAAEGIAATDKAISRSGTQFSGKQIAGDITTSYTASFLGKQLVRIEATSSQGDYGSRTDRLYFDEGTDSEGYPFLRASILTARRVAREPVSGSPGQTAVVPGKYEQVVQKLILDDAGKAMLATKSVDGQKQEVTDADRTAARNFARIVSAEVLRVARRQP